MNNNETVTDIDGNVYHTVTIGTQVWMLENLNTTHFNDGTAIPHPDRLPSYNEAYFDYNRNPLISAIFGRLYNWFAVNTGKLCPKGWHVPSDKEWETLVNYLGGDIEAGGKLKEEGTNHWKSDKIKANNSSGFTALPGGSYDEGGFSSIGEHGFWWSSTEFYRANFWEPDNHNAWYLRMVYYFNSVEIKYGISNSKRTAMSVRCLKD